MITPIYAAVLSLIYVFLSFRVIKQRRKNQIAIGDGENQNLMRAMRVHGNFAEYVPLGLVLVFFLESLVGSSLTIHIFATALLLGRILHAYGVSKISENIIFRQGGMILTFSVLIGCSIRILISYL